MQKRCCTCKAEKPIEEFNKNKSTKDGLAHACNACGVERHKNYYQKNKEIIKEKVREYNRNNKEKRRKYLIKTKDHRAEVHKLWYDKNLDRILNNAHEYYIRNSEMLRQKAKDYSKSNPEAIRIANKKQYQKDISKSRRRGREYYEENRDAIRAALRPLEREAVINLSDSYIKQILTQRSVLVAKDIPQSLINAYRENLRVKRLLNEITN